MPESIDTIRTHIDKLAKVKEVDSALAAKVINHCNAQSGCSTTLTGDPFNLKSANRPRGKRAE